MKAFDAGASSEAGLISRWKSEHAFPRVFCEACRETQWVTNVWYPALGLKPTAEPSLFSNERTISVDEFKTLGRQVEGIIQTGERFQPTAGIGVVTAKIPKRISDFWWCEGRPIISIRAFQALSSASVKIVTSPLRSLTGAEEQAYLAWQVPVLPMYSDLCLQRLTLKQCNKCLGWNLQNLRADQRIKREYLASRIPSHAGLIRVEEGGETLATNLLISVVHGQKLTGIKMTEWGTYV